MAQTQTGRTLERAAQRASTIPVAPSQQTVRGATAAPASVPPGSGASLSSDGAATSALLSPSGNGPRASGAKVPKRPKAAPEQKAGPPELPADDAPWTTRTCLALFDAWRGVTLIGVYKNSQASSCAKGLVERYSRAEVEAAKARMDKDKYYMERGGADVCDVANNIHKYRKRASAAPVSTIVPMDEATDSWGSTGFDIYKGNGPEERKRLAEIGMSLPDSYWE